MLYAMRSISVREFKYWSVREGTDTEDSILDKYMLNAYIYLDTHLFVWIAFICWEHIRLFFYFDEFLLDNVKVV
jgi:hypothetical protein